MKTNLKVSYDLPDEGDYDLVEFGHEGMKYLKGKTPKAKKNLMEKLAACCLYSPDDVRKLGLGYAYGIEYRGKWYRLFWNLEAMTLVLTDFPIKVLCNRMEKPVKHKRINR